MHIFAYYTGTSESILDRYPLRQLDKLKEKVLENPERRGLSDTQKKPAISNDDYGEIAQMISSSSEF